MTGQAGIAGELFGALGRSFASFADAPEWDAEWGRGTWLVEEIRGRLRDVAGRCASPSGLRDANRVNGTAYARHLDAPADEHEALTLHTRAVQRRLSRCFAVADPLPPKGEGALRTHIRWMIRRDLPEVLEIEERSFEFPRSEEDVISRLRQRNCIGMVAEAAERVIGFMIYELHTNRMRLFDLAVHPDARRRGAGAAMVRKLLGKLSAERRNRILLEIRESNLHAQLFFRDFLGEGGGFRAISVLRDFYPDTHEAAYLMQYRCRGEEAENDVPAACGSSVG